MNNVKQYDYFLISFFGINIVEIYYHFTLSMFTYLQKNTLFVLLRLCYLSSFVSIYKRRVNVDNLIY